MFARTVMGWGAALGVAALLVGCSGDSPTEAVEEEPELRVSPSQGSGQSGVVNQELPHSLVVSARNVAASSSQPAPGVEVCFDPATGGAGHPSRRCVVSGADGRAATDWVLGTVAGDHTISATSGEGGSVEFRVTALAGELADLDWELTLPVSRMRKGSTRDFRDHLEVQGGYDRWSNEIDVGEAEAAVLELPAEAVRWELLDASSSAVGNAGWGWSFEPPDPAAYGFEATGRVSVTCEGELRSEQDEANGVPGVELHAYRVRILLTLTLDGLANTVSSSEGGIQTPSDAEQVGECGEVVL